MDYDPDERVNQRFSFWYWQWAVLQVDVAGRLLRHPNRCSMMRRLHYLGFMWGLLAGCAPSLEKRMRQPATYPGTNTPMRLDFDFKPFYDSSEVFQKRGVYYTRLMRRPKGKYEWADTLVEPQKLQGGIHILVQGPATAPGQPGPLLRSSQGLFFDGRKDNLWLYVKFVQARLLPDSPIQTLPSPDSTIVEEYDRGKLLSRKRGEPYRGSP